MATITGMPGEGALERFIGNSGPGSAAPPKAASASTAGRYRPDYSMIAPASGGQSATGNAVRGAMSYLSRVPGAVRQQAETVRNSQGYAAFGDTLGRLFDPNQDTLGDAYPAIVGDAAARRNRRAQRTATVPRGTQPAPSFGVRREDGNALPISDRLMAGMRNVDLRPPLRLNAETPTASSALAYEQSPALGVRSNFNVPDGARILGGGRVMANGAVPEAEPNTLRSATRTLRLTPDVMQRAGITRDADGNFIGRLGDSEVNPYTGRNALQEFDEANRIRGEMLKSTALRDGPFNAARDAIFIGQQEPSMPDRVNALMERAGRTRDPYAATSMRRQADAMMDATRIQNTADAAAAGEAGDMARAEMNAAIEGPYREALAQAAMGNAQGSDPRNPSWLTPDSLEAVRTQLESQGLQPAQVQQGINELLASLLADVKPGSTRGMAEGGIVEPPSAMGRSAAMLTPQMPNMQVMQDYQRLNSGLSAMGLPPIDFESFQSMKFQPPVQSAGAPTPGVMGFAAGGPVPDLSGDVSGKMVVDTDPTAPTDSIPAMIDGQQPAALDSGEFVFPKDVVLFYGLDKLNKMIASARKVEGDGSTAQQPGVSAIQSAQRPQ